MSLGRNPKVRRNVESSVCQSKALWMHPYSCHDIGITLTAEASPEVDQDVLLFRTALVSVATLYRMKADATICISRSLLKFIYWLQCNTIAVKMYLVLQ